MPSISGKRYRNFRRVYAKNRTHVSQGAMKVYSRKRPSTRALAQERALRKSLIHTIRHKKRLLPIDLIDLILQYH